VVAAPAAFMADGQEQIAILVGARGLPPKQDRTSKPSANNSRLLVFKAGGTAKLPTEKVEGVSAASATLNPPLMTASNEDVFAGEQVFDRSCRSCHGRNAAPGAGSIGPDLRYSALLRSPDQFRRTVTDGALVTRGMPGFGNILKPAEVDQLLAYVIKRANDEKAALQATKR